MTTLCLSPTLFLSLSFFLSFFSLSPSLRPTSVLSLSLSLSLSISHNALHIFYLYLFISISLSYSPTLSLLLLLSLSLFHTFSHPFPFSLCLPGDSVVARALLEVDTEDSKNNIKELSFPAVKDPAVTRERKAKYGEGRGGTSVSI